MSNEPRTTRTEERLSAIEQAVSRMEAELAAFADHTAKQFEDFVRQVGSAHTEWNERIREAREEQRSEAKRIEQAGKIPWVGILALALTVCTMAAGLVKFSLEARTSTLEVQQKTEAEKNALAKESLEKHIELNRTLAEQAIRDLREHINRLEQSRK